MSSLIFLIAPDYAYVATDTLATTLDEGKPFKFSTKAFPVAHLRMIVSSTGIGGFGLNWYIQINDNIVVPDVQRLDLHTPSALRKLWRDYKNQLGIGDEQGATIYHFGFSEMDGQIHTYAYRSTNDFVSEQLQYGFGTKPPIEEPAQYELPRDFKMMMDIQRAAERSKPAPERVGIGGEIQTILLNKDGFSISTVAKFDDYESDKRIIYSQFGSMPRLTHS